MQVKVLQVGPIGTNCYLLEDEKAHVAAIIDPGDEAGRILQVIEDDGVDVKYILLTHGHYDHTTAVPELHQALPQAEIYIHKADANGAGSRLFPLAGQIPDLKFYAPETSGAYASCPDYFSVAAKAIPEMFRQVGQLKWDGELLRRGLVVRHLVLPAHRKESMQLLDWLAETLPTDAFLLSLMGQYTPPDTSLPDKHLNRRIATFEYESVREHAVQLGLNGYGQERSSASASYTPDFWTE